MNRIFRYLSVVMVCLAFFISFSAEGKYFLRNKYYYEGENNSTVIMGYNVSQYSRESSERNKYWACVEDVWYDNGLRFVVKDLNVSRSDDYARSLIASGTMLTSITLYNVPGLEYAKLGHSHDDYSKCTIKSNAFKSSTSLNQIYIDKSIGTIESQAFYGMTEGIIEFNEMKPPTLALDAFCEEAYSNVILIIPDSKISLFKDSNWSRFKNIVPSSQFFCDFSEDSYKVQISTSKTLSFNTDINISEFQWSSSDITIAEVNNGVVTGIDNGVATITATNKYGYSFSCTVNVVPPVESLEISSINGIIKDNTLILDPNSSFDLSNININIIPENAYDKTLSWSCKNPEIAYITDNILHTVKSGFTTLTATSVSGVSVSIPILIRVRNRDEFDYDGVLYKIIGGNNKTCMVMGFTLPNESDLIIPAQLDLFDDIYSVIYIYKDAFKASNIASVFIPNSIKSIGSNAFASCQSLKDVIIEDGETILNFDNEVFSNTSISKLYLGRSFIYNSEHLYEGLFLNQKCLSDLIIGEKVTSIAKFAFNGCSSLSSVEIPYSVTEIGEYAFSGCSSLSSVEIPNLVTTIGDGTFSGCSSLSSVKIPNSVTTIGKHAFSKCSKLSDIDIPNSVTSIGICTFLGCSSLSLVQIPNSVTKIGLYAFEGCSSLRSVQIPNSVTEIGAEAFKECSSLRSVQIPNSVTEIGEGTFSGCSSLESIDLPNSVTSIGAYAFHNCNHLPSIEIPESVISIGEEAFCGCAGLEEIIIADGEKALNLGSLVFHGIKNTKLYLGRYIKYPNGDISPFEDWRRADYQVDLIIGEKFTFIPENAYSQWYGLTSVEIPNSVTSIGAEAFRACYKLASVQIPNSVTEIGEYAFSECSSLSSVEIPNSVTEIREYTFRECSSLESINLPNSVTSIGAYAFHNCNHLPSIEIPESVISIGEEAFCGCAGLEEIIIADGEKALNLGSLVFQGIENTKLYLGRDIKYPNGDISPFGSWRQTDYQVDLIIGKKFTFIPEIAYSQWYGLTSVEIPNSVTSIGAKTFRDCYKLASVQIPNSVTTIGASTFSGCSSLSSVKIPNSVTEIGQYAFSECSSLESIDLPNSVTSIGEGTFRYCYKLASVQIPNSVTSIGASTFKNCYKLASVQIPNSVTEIGQYAFSECSSLESIDLPNSVTSIGEEAFSNCDNLSSVMLMGNPELNWKVFSECKQLSTIICYADCPVESSENAFDDEVKESATLYVPKGCKSNYKSIIPWKNFIYIKEIGEVDINSISIDCSSCTLNKGETLKLSVTILPHESTDKTISWTSSNLEVANVDDEGVVTALGIGSATITATTVNGLSASCEVTVLPVIAQFIELNIEGADLEKGETFQLVATITPYDTTDKTVTWTSSNPEVATVDENGLVTAFGVGSATITVTTVNGLTATCEVTVLPVLVEAITLDPNIIKGIIGEKFVIKASVLPENASNPHIEWESSNPNVASVDQEGNVVINKEGSCRIIAYATDGSNVTGECFLTGTSGIESIFAECGEHISIYTPGGLLIKKDCKSDDLKNLVPGVYIFKSEKKTISVIIP